MIAWRGRTAARAATRSSGADDDLQRDLGGRRRGGRHAKAPRRAPGAPQATICAPVPGYPPERVVAGVADGRETTRPSGKPGSSRAATDLRSQPFHVSGWTEPRAAFSGSATPSLRRHTVKVHEGPDVRAREVTDRNLPAHPVSYQNGPTAHPGKYGRRATNLSSVGLSRLLCR
jgi:hypothetical protein